MSFQLFKNSLGETVSRELNRCTSFVLRSKNISHLYHSSSSWVWWII